MSKSIMTMFYSIAVIILVVIMNTYAKTSNNIIKNAILHDDFSCPVAGTCFEGNAKECLHKICCFNIGACIKSKTNIESHIKVDCSCKYHD